jgi:type IVB pilus formation R64 PilN family outer membrane protein
MPTNKKYLCGFVYCLLLGVASCSLPTDEDAAIERDVDATIQYKEDAKAPQTPADTDVIRIKDDIWLGDTSEIEYEGDKPLPNYLETSDGITLVSNRPITLYEIGNMIAKISGIKMRFAPQLESAAKAAADKNAPNVKKVGTKWSDTSRMLVSYKGSLSGLLDEVCSYFGVWWKYENGEIYIYKYTTKTFTLYTLPTNPSMTSSVSSSSGGGSISSGVSNIDLWGNIVTAVRSMLGSGSSLVTDPMNGTLTITATPTEIKKVSKFINEQNIRLSRQVAISVKVLQVEIDDSKGFGFNLQAAFKDRTANGGNITLKSVSGPSALSDTDRNASMSMGIISGDLSLDAVMNSLSSQGVTTLVTSGTVTTMNNKPAPIQVVKKQNYVSEITKTTSGSTSDNYDISVSTDEIETGFTLDVLPRIMDHGRLMMLFSLSLSDLLELEKVIVDEQAGSFVQNPNTEERGFSQEIALKSGETLVLSGYERVETQSQKEGLGAVNNNLFGGSQLINKTRTILVILITPVVLESPLLPESRMKF